ncbi:MAG: hypothetical protein COA82_03725 [Alkaliphilus sp.]|nr:MAG: hypothetical protein COA82_03725 [Alkaliphilus sp.]
METLKVVSAKTVIAKVIKTYKPNGDGWIGDAMQWIGEGLNQMGIQGNTVLVKKTIQVVGWRAALPCDIESLEYICYNGSYLTINNQTLATADSCGLQVSHASAIINGCAVQPTFETGEIDIHYRNLILDGDNFPMIPKSELLNEALSWFIMRNYLLQGNTHPVVDFPMADAMWLQFQPRAQNDVSFPTPIGQEAFANMWVNLVPQFTQHYKGFVNNSVGFNDAARDNTGGSLIKQINTDTNEATT